MSLNDRNKRKDTDRSKDKDRDKDGGMAAFESVFNLPQEEPSEGDRATKEYCDFSSVARAVLLSISRLESS